MTEDYGSVYLRVSDDDQETVPEQLQMCQERAAMMGVPIPEDAIFVDKGESRSLFLKREGLQAALERTKDPHCKYVFVWIFTRLYGDVEQQLQIFKVLRRNGVRLFNAAGHEQNTPEHSAKLTDMISAWQSEGEVIELRKRVRDTHTVKAKNGRLISRPPYGIKVVPALSLECKGVNCVDQGKGCPTPHSADISKKNGTVWIIDEPAMQNVKMMFDWAANGVTMYAIEDRLKKAGIRSPERVVKRGKNAGASAGGAYYTRDNIRRILQNRFYLGEAVWGQRRVEREDEIKRYVPTPQEEWIIRPHGLGELIDSDVWHEAQRQIDLRLNKREGEGRRYPTLLLDGLVQCGRCGRGMYPRKRGHKRSEAEAKRMIFDYHCGGKYEVYSTCVTNHVIAESWLIGLLTNDPSMFKMRGRTPDVQVAWAVEEGPDKIGPELRALDARVAELEGNLAQVEKMVLGSFYTIEQGVAKKRELEAERDAAAARKAELLAAPKGADAATQEAPPSVRTLLRLLGDERLPIDQRRLSLSRLVTRIVVDRPSVTILLREDAVEERLQA